MGAVSADLGGRVGWLPKAERVKTLFLPCGPGMRGGGWGGGGRGGIPASFPSRSPPPKQPFQPTPTPSPGSHQEVCEKIVFERFGGAPSPGGPGPKPPGDLAHRPGTWIPPLSLTEFPSSLQHFRPAGPKPLEH